MFARSMQQAPQNKAEFATGVLWRLLIAVPGTVFVWWWFDELSFTLFIAAAGPGGALGYAFAHGQRRFQQRLRFIGVLTYAIGIVLVIGGLVLMVSGVPLSESAVGILLLPFGGLLLIFGAVIQREDKKLRATQPSG